MIWYIHGAYASPSSFNYLRAVLPTHEFRDFKYDCDTSLAKTIETFVEQAKDDESPSIISHSLGGVIALSASKRINANKIVTMSSPFGGSRAASLLRWIAPSRLLEDIRVNSPVMTELRQMSFEDADIMSIVTTGGGGVFEGIGEPHDGVVTVASQTAITGPDYHRTNRNHFDVLLCAEVVEKIENYMFVRET